MTNPFSAVYNATPFFLTEGAVGTRLAEEFGLTPDAYIDKAGLLYNPAGRKALTMIYRQYLQVAADCGLPLILMTNTRRANRARMTLANKAYQNVIADYTRFLRELAADYPCPTYIGGIMGCRGDAYTGAGALTAAEALAFHSWQAEKMADAGVDFVFEAIMPHVQEAIGLSRAVAAVGLPYVVSFMLRRSGQLPDGHFLHTAMEAVEEAMMGHAPLGYMVNCIHPAILHEALSQAENRTDLVRARFHGIQSNAANAEPEELENAAAVKTSDAADLCAAVQRLHALQPLKIIGGCCGTDETHMRALAWAMQNGM